MSRGASFSGLQPKSKLSALCCRACCGALASLLVTPRSLNAFGRGIVRWYFLPGAVELGQSLKTWWKNGDTLAARRRGGKQTIDGVRNVFFGILS